MNLDSVLGKVDELGSQWEFSFVHNFLCESVSRPATDLPPQPGPEPCAETPSDASSARCLPSVDVPRSQHQSERMRPPLQALVDPAWFDVAVLRSRFALDVPVKRVGHVDQHQVERALGIQPSAVPQSHHVRVAESLQRGGRAQAASTVRKWG